MVACLMQAACACCVRALSVRGRSLPMGEGAGTCGIRLGPVSYAP